MAITDAAKDRTGPLPNWVWGGLVFILVVIYLLYRKRQSASQTSQSGNQSNLGTVPISNLTTDAEPMPIQQGDTFVNVSDTDGGTGPTGPAGPAGPPGKPGPPGPGAKGKPNPPHKKLTPAPKPHPTPQPGSNKTYTVKSGDSLWKIATQYYGNGNDWPTIYNANKALIGANPNKIYPGQVLTIPAKAA